MQPLDKKNQCKNPVVAVAHVMPISALHNRCSTHRGSQVQNLVCLLCVQRTGGWRGFHFFLSECCMAQRRSLSGRSPFCQRKLSEESQFTGNLFPRKQQTQNYKKRKKHQSQCSLPESAGWGRCSLFLGRLDQGLVGNAESTHVNHPKGKAMLFAWVGRCCKFLKSNKLGGDYLRRMCSAG